MASRMENWSIGDYLKHFEKEVDLAAEDRFKVQFKALAHELEELDSEFLKETKGCSKELDPIFDQLHSLAGRLRYCETPRGFEKDCNILYGDVDKAIKAVSDFRKSCSD